MKASLIAASALAFGIAGAASASTVTFTSFDSTNGDQLNPTVSISDDVSGELKFEFDLPASQSGSLIAAYFQFANTVDLSTLELAQDVPKSNPVIESGGLADDFSVAQEQNGACGPNADIGTNIGALTAPSFQLAVCWKKEDTRGIDPVVLVADITGGAISATDIIGVGLRYQESSNREESDKLLSFTTTSVTPVPLPAAGWMLVAGLGGLAAVKRRKR